MTYRQTQTIGKVTYKQAQTIVEDGVHLALGEGVAAVGELAFATNENAPALDLLARPLEREAHVMAERGASYRQILQKYFPSTRVASSNGASASADLMWGHETESSTYKTSHSDTVPRLILRSEDFHINYPSTTDKREVEGLLSLLQASRKSLLARVNAAGINVQFTALEVFYNI